ncbi:hypothetical protein RQ727_16690 [Acinetobacter baumannii]|uniref:hypothetical protein n=1 Tax=Acinetobacter baumannii TaxID=470 RepID=UPI0028CFAD32|nr:hypothetical protein [Acinetobacter baumannii]MDT7995557.1 hypothetical protein [Acinetobacter baumannii]
MFELIPINRKNKLREIRIIKAFLIFAFVLCLLILYIEYQKYAHINWKFVYITCLCMIWDFDLNKKILCTRQISQNPYPIRVLPS